jgi:hypothetical protein
MFVLTLHTGVGLLVSQLVYVVLCLLDSAKAAGAALELRTWLADGADVDRR